MKDEFDLDAELIKGSNGVFEVELDGDLIFSKKELGRFPDDGEVAGILRDRLGD